MLRFDEKYYLVDPGLRQAAGMDNASAIDRTLEDIVHLELRRRGYTVTVGKVGDKEVDFVATRAGRTHYFQVTYLCAEGPTREREFGAFEAIHDNYPKTVLSLDEFPYSRNGIQGQNIIDWLLGGVKLPRQAMPANPARTAADAAGTFPGGFVGTGDCGAAGRG